MTTSESNVAADLAFVAAAVRRRERRPVPLNVAIVWGIYIVIGYAWIDWSPRTAGMFFLAMWPLGMVMTYLAKRWWGADPRTVGVLDSADAWRSQAHFYCIFVGVAAAIAMAVTKQISGMACGQLCAMLSGMVYFIAGVHFNPRFYLLGIVLMAGAVMAPLAPGWGWTVLGILTAGGLVAAALIPDKNTVVA